MNDKEETLGKQNVISYAIARIGLIDRSLENKGLNCRKTMILL